MSKLYYTSCSMNKLTNIESSRILYIYIYTSCTYFINFIDVTHTFDFSMYRSLVNDFICRRLCCSKLFCLDHKLLYVYVQCYIDAKLHKSFFA